MKHLMLILALILGPMLANPVSAQDAERGLSLMERGAKLFFDGLLREVEPGLRDLEGALREMEPALQDFVARMGPAMTDLMSQVDDLANYDPPVMLPNGDIILRRKATVPPALRPDPNSDPVPDPDTGAVDL